MYNKEFSKQDYKWYDPDKESYIKYNEIDNQTELDLEDDPAYVHSDGHLVSPSIEQCKELYNYCDWTWTTIDGVNGYKVQSKDNDNYIFLPVNGYCYADISDDKKRYGQYWTNSLNYNRYAYSLYFTKTDIIPNNVSNRYNHFSIRGALR